MCILAAFITNPNRCKHKLFFVITKNSPINYFYSIQANSQGVCWETRDMPACHLTPYQEAQTKAKHNYKVVHTRTRAHLEMLFGLIRSRFQCLNHLRVTPERACDITIVCVVLQNIACLGRERPPKMVLEEDWGNEAIFDGNEMGRVIRHLCK